MLSTEPTWCSAVQHRPTNLYRTGGRYSATCHSLSTSTSYNIADTVFLESPYPVRYTVVFRCFWGRTRRVHCTKLLLYHVYSYYWCAQSLELLIVNTKWEKSEPQHWFQDFNEHIYIRGTKRRPHLAIPGQNEHLQIR